MSNLDQQQKIAQNFVQGLKDPKDLAGSKGLVGPKGLKRKSTEPRPVASKKQKNSNSLKANPKLKQKVKHQFINSNVYKNLF